MLRGFKGFSGGSVLKNLPANSGGSGLMGQEDPLEKEMATHSSILNWRIRWTLEPGGLQSVGSQRVGRDLVTKHTRTHTYMRFHTTVMFELYICCFLTLRHPVDNCSLFFIIKTLLHFLTFYMHSRHIYNNYNIISRFSQLTNRSIRI